MGWIPYSSVYCYMHVGSYRYVPSCKALKIDATRGPRRAVLICSGKPLGIFWLEARVPASGGWERWEGLTGGEIMSGRANRRVEKWWCGYLPRLVLFRLVAPSLQLGEVGSFSGMGCLVPQLFAIEENRSYPVRLGRNRWPTVPGVTYPDRKYKCIHWYIS
jgi:hypothetical protein